MQQTAELFDHLSASQLKPTVRLRRDGVNDVVNRDRPVDAFERQFANRFDGRYTFDLHQDPRANQDLPGLGFVAKPRGDIGYRPDGGIVETSLKANDTEGRKSVRNTDAKSKLVSQPTP